MTTKDDNIHGLAVMITQMSLSQINDFSRKLSSALTFGEDVEIYRDINGIGTLSPDMLRDALHSWAERELSDRRLAEDTDALPF